MNDVCLRNSALLRSYATASESVFVLGHLVKIWAKRSGLVSSNDNGFSLPTSYAWIILCVFFVQERLKAAPVLVSDSGRLEDVWGCKNALFVDGGELEGSDPLRLPPRSPAVLFIQFLHFVVEEAEGLGIDLCKDRAYPLRQPGINVMDPLEVDRNVTKNVEDWSYVRQTCAMYLDRIERVRSVAEFLSVLEPGWNRDAARIDTVHDLIPL
jgi:hypothetical protein